MTEVKVARLVDPKWFAEKRVQRLFHDAFAGSPVFPGGFDPIAKDLVLLCAKPDASVFLIGEEDGALKGLALILMPTNALTPLPQVGHFYNGGSRDLRKKLTRAVVDVVKAAGYTKFWTINATGKPDSVWARAYRSAGTGTPIGGLIEFDIEKKAK